MSIPLLASFLLALAAVAFVALPLVRREEIADNDTFAIVDPTLEDLLFSREVTYAAIKDLTFERDMGKLSEEDFEQLDHQYRARAVDILQELDQVEKVTTDDELDRWIEEAVRTARQERTTRTPARVLRQETSPPFRQEEAGLCRANLLLLRPAVHRR